MSYYMSNGRRNYFITFGQGRPLVLLHGITNSGRAWGGQIGPLTTAGFQLIIPDLAGHGASEPVHSPVSVYDLANDAQALLDHLKIEKADVLGLSLGGMVAMQLAEEAPERVGRLMIANSFPATTGEHFREMALSWAATFRQPDGPVKRFEQVWPINASETYRQSVQGTQMYQIFHGLAAAAKGESFAQVAEGIIGFDITDRLSRLPHQTLFIAGALDSMSPPALSQQMAQAVPHSQYVELAGAAHLSNVDSAMAFNEAVLAFLAD